MPGATTVDPDRDAVTVRTQATWRRRWRRIWRERALLLSVFMALTVSRVALLVVPFRRLARMLGPADIESPTEVGQAALAEANRLAWAIRVLSRRTPWARTCFPQALAGLALLRRHRVPSTLYLGVALRPDRSGLEAHAWLRCGTLYVTGGHGHHHYGIVARFGEAPQNRLTASDAMSDDAL